MRVVDDERSAQPQPGRCHQVARPAMARGAGGKAVRQGRGGGGLKKNTKAQNLVLFRFPRRLPLASSLRPMASRGRGVKPDGFSFLVQAATDINSRCECECVHKPHPTYKIQGAPKKEKKSDVPIYLPVLRFFEIFRSDFRKNVYGVFGLLMQRNGQKRDKIKSTGKYERKKVFFSLNFFGQKFLTWIFSKKFFMVFLNSPC
jgi:hypothetical protein